MNPNEYTGLLSHLYSPFDLTKNYSNFARQIESSGNPLVSDNLEGIKSSSSEEEPTKWGTWGTWGTYVKSGVPFGVPMTSR